MKTLDNLYWRVKFGVMNWVEDFLTDEEGDSNLVSVIVLIVIVLAAAAIFRDKIMEAVEKIMDKFIEFVNSTGN